ncbi:MAG: hypothetical protein QXY61_03655 [Candidatus Anstonellales archaeon]
MSIRVLRFAFALFLLLSIFNAVDLSTCGSLSSNTYYEVTQDLNTGDSQTPCLVAYGVSNVVVNLKGYSVRGIKIQNSANNITIENGSLALPGNYFGSFAYLKIYIRDSSNITIKNVSHYAYCTSPGCSGPEIANSMNVYFYEVSSTLPSDARGGNPSVFFGIQNTTNATFERLKYSFPDSLGHCTALAWTAILIDSSGSGAKKSNNIVIKQSEITGSCNGILSYTENLTLYNNIIDTYDVQIWPKYCNNNITSNMGKNSLYPIVYMEHNSSQTYSPGSVSQLIFCNISNFQVTGPTAIYGGILLVNSSNNTFNGFSTNTTYTGIVFDRSKDNKFYNGGMHNGVYGVLFYATDGVASTGNSFENTSSSNITDRVFGGCGVRGECVCNFSVKNASLNGFPAWFNTTTNGITVSNVNLNELTFCDVENSTVSNVNITNGTGFWSFSSANILVENSNISNAHYHNLFSYLDDNITIRNSDLSYFRVDPSAQWAYSHSTMFSRSQNITVENITSYETNGFAVYIGTNANVFNSKIINTKSGGCYYCSFSLGFSGTNAWAENNTVISDETNLYGIVLGIAYNYLGGNITARNNTIMGKYVGIALSNHPGYPQPNNNIVNITRNLIQNSSYGIMINPSTTNITEISFNRIENKIASRGSTACMYSVGSSYRGMNVSIFNNTMYNATYGYYASYGIRDHIFNNTICNVNTVFYLYHSTEIYIGNNSICDDIYTPIDIVSDNSQECAHGVNFTVNETNPVYFSNIDDVVFENNDSIAQIFLCNVSRARVQNITMRRENAQYGVWAVLTRYSNITDFRCYNMNSNVYCVYFKHLDFENRVKDSIIVNNTYGIRISENSNTTHVYNNTFENNTYSVYLEGYLNNISTNSFKNPKSEGVEVYLYALNSNNNTISNNTFTQLTNGYAFKIVYKSASGNVFEWNTVNGPGEYYSPIWISGQINTFIFNTLNGTKTSSGFLNRANGSVFYNNTIENFSVGIYNDYRPGWYAGNNSLIYHNFFRNITNYYVWWDSHLTVFLNTSVSGVAQGNYYDDILEYQIYDSDDNSYCDYGDQYPYGNPPTAKLPATPPWKDYGPIILGGIYDHPNGENESAYSAFYLNKYIYDLERHYTTSFIRYNHSTQGLRLMVKGHFHFGDVNISNASIYTGALETGGNYTVINATSAAGINETISFFVPNFLDQGVFVCPNAESPQELTYNCEGYTSFDITECEAGTTKNGITVNLITFLGQEYYNITHAQKRGGAGEEIGANLTIWDTSDNETICPGENITFFANYSNATSGEPILNADCNISFEDGVSAMMWYNDSSLLYEYNRSFDNPGIYYYNVTCNATDYPTRFREDHAQVFICGVYLYGVNVTVINISKYNYTYEVGRYPLRPGNITNLNIDMNVSTEKWAGFYGNISNGTYLVLGDAVGNFMYKWPWGGEEGKGRVVCTSTNGSLYFINLTGALGSEIDTAWNFLPNAADSGTNTFNQQCDITFGAYTIQNAACRPTGYWNFYTRALKIYPWLGHKDQMVFCTNITSATSFVDTPVDFELIVPTEYGMGSGPPYEIYYFYVSIE